jgi:threonyl-tRNA synthetase
VYWHSAAHVLGAALEEHYGTQALLCDGPPVLDAEGGFFYELHLQQQQQAAVATATSAAAVPAARSSAPALPALAKLRVREEDYAPLEAAARRLVAARAPFERLVVSRDVAASMFVDNRFKLDALARIPDGQPVTLYRCGVFVDLCRGPHVPHTGFFRGLALYKSSGSHWAPPAAAAGKGASEAQGLVVSGGGDASGSSASRQLPAAGTASPRLGELLQRVYGVAFPTPGQLTAWRARLEEARARDHRVIGRAQQLFFFHELSPGSVFMLPAGTRIYNKVGGG